MYLTFFKLEEKTFYVPEKYLINLTKVYTFRYIIKFNQIRSIQFGGHISPNPPAGALPPAPPPGLRPWAPPPYSPFHHLSCHIYQYYYYNMLLFHRVVIGHSQYHSTDTRNTCSGRILQKISCLPRRLVISGLDRCIQSSSPPRYTFRTCLLNFPL